MLAVARPSGAIRPARRNFPPKVFGDVAVARFSRQLVAPRRADDLRDGGVDVNAFQFVAPFRERRKDALVIEAPDADINHAVCLTREAMLKASETVLAGFPLRTDAKVIRYPNRYQDERGATMWGWLTETLERVEDGERKEGEKGGRGDEWIDR